MPSFFGTSFCNEAELREMLEIFKKSDLVTMVSRGLMWKHRTFPLVYIYSLKISQ